MRLLFTDGWNSISHALFGIAAYWVWWILPLFLAYQLKDPMDTNLFIDYTEFFLGYGFAIYLLGDPIEGRYDR
jgi:hypothetical protein